MARLVPYQSRIVEVVFGGFDLSDGRGDPFFQIAPQGPKFVLEGPGADGHVTRCATNNNTYTITLTYKGTSNAHARLSALHTADLESDNGAGIAPLLLKDRGGSTLIATDQCWIVTFNELAFGITRPDVAWELHAVISPSSFVLGGA